MSVLDVQVHVAEETTYGTPATPTRSFEATAFAHKRSPGFIESRGARAGAQATRSDRRRIVNMGAVGGLELDVLNKGFGLLFRQLFGNSFAIAQQGATTAWLQTHQSTADGPAGRSMTVQVGKPPVSGAVQPFTYHGGKGLSWEFSQRVAVGTEGNLKLKIDLDYEDEDTSTLLASPAYPANTVPFAWPDWSVTVDGNPFHAREGSVKGDNNLNTERRYGRASALKKEPLRKGFPKLEGMVLGDFEDLTLYAEFIAGGIVPIVFTWTGESITTGHNFQLILTMAACQFNGETPDADLEDLPRLPLPFEVLWDGTNPAVKLEYKSTDTAF